MVKVQLPVCKTEEYRISDFGAVPGGVVSCTKAIQKAIDQAAEKGGGRIKVPGGIWLTGAIQ